MIYLSNLAEAQGLLCPWFLLFQQPNLLFFYPSQDFLVLQTLQKQNRSTFTKILCLQNFSVRLMLCPCHINVFNEEKLKPTWCKSIRVYFVLCNLKILKRNRMIIFISLIFQSSCTTAHNPNHFRG